jgi:hypothetical protein
MGSPFSSTWGVLISSALYSKKACSLIKSFDGGQVIPIRIFPSWSAEGDSGDSMSLSPEQSICLTCVLQTLEDRAFGGYDSRLTHDEFRFLSRLMRLPKGGVAPFEGAPTTDRKIHLGASKWREQKSLTYFMARSWVATKSNSCFGSFPLRSSGFFRKRSVNPI